MFRVLSSLTFTSTIFKNAILVFLDGAGIIDVLNAGGPFKNSPRPQLRTYSYIYCTNQTSNGKKTRNYFQPH
jgi:hypothetical protein